jgi:hypothetical protein
MPTTGGPLEVSSKHFRVAFPVARNIMNRCTVLIVITLLGLAIIAPQSAFAQSDPLIGTWKLNLAKSTYSAGRPPRGDTITFEGVEGGRRSTVETIDAQGNSSKRVTIEFDDGKFHPVTGVPAFDAQATKRVNESTTWEIRTKAGKVVQTLILAVSADGKTESVTVAGVTANGLPLYNVIVRDKQ